MASLFSVASRLPVEVLEVQVGGTQRVTVRSNASFTSLAKQFFRLWVTEP